MLEKEGRGQPCQKKENGKNNFSSGKRRKGGKKKRGKKWVIKEKEWLGT